MIRMPKMKNIAVVKQAKRTTFLEMATCKIRAWGQHHVNGWAGFEHFSIMQKAAQMFRESEEYLMFGDPLQEPTEFQGLQGRLADTL